MSPPDGIDTKISAPHSLAPICHALFLQQLLRCLDHPRQIEEDTSHRRVRFKQRGDEPAVSAGYIHEQLGA